MKTTPSFLIWGGGTFNIWVKGLASSHTQLLSVPAFTLNLFELSDVHAVSYPCEFLPWNQFQHLEVDGYLPGKLGHPHLLL